MRIRLHALWNVLLGRGVMYRMHVRVPSILFFQEPSLVAENHIELVPNGCECEEET